jgi:hypothetical protein
MSYFIVKINNILKVTRFFNKLYFAVTSCKPLSSTIFNWKQELVQQNVLIKLFLHTKD